MANPLLIKGGCCVLGIGVAIVSTHLYRSRFMGEDVGRVKVLEEDSRVVVVETVDNTEEQNQCAHKIDKIAKDIKAILSIYFDNWVPKNGLGEISKADKESLLEKKNGIESWRRSYSSNCGNGSGMEGQYQKMVDYLGNPGITDVEERYRTPMKELLKGVGISTWESY